MGWIKKYWWIGLLFLVLPVVINFVLLIPAFTPIVGDNTIWLGFWGSYLGAIISAGVAFVILAIQHKQNREENKRNRELQINVIKHQQEQARLNSIIDILAKMITYTDVSEILRICDNIGKPNQNVIDQLDDILYNVNKYNTELELYVDSEKLPFKGLLNDFIWLFIESLMEVKSVIFLFNIHNGAISTFMLKKYLDNISKKMDAIILDYTDSINHVLNYRNCREIVNRRVEIVLDLQNKIDECVRDYITSEKERIDNILTVNSPKDAK